MASGVLQASNMLGAHEMGIISLAKPCPPGTACYSAGAALGDGCRPVLSGWSASTVLGDT